MIEFPKSIANVISALSIVTLGRVGGAVLGLISQIYLARMLSANELGGFFLAVSVAGLLAVVANFGLPLIATRFIVKYRSRNPGDHSVAFIKTARLFTIVASMLLTALAALLIVIWTEPGSEQRLIYLIGCFAAPGFALSSFSGAVASAHKHFLLSYLPDLVVRPIVFLAALLFLGTFTSNLELWVVMAIFASLINLQGLFMVLATNRFTLNTAKLPYDTRSLPTHWIKTALPLTVVALFTATFADFSIFSSGLFLERHDIALFGICIKITLMAGFVQMTAHKIMQPIIAEAIAADNPVHLSRVVARATLLGIGLNIGALVFFAITGKMILKAFGNEFIAGYGFLLAMLAGQVLVSAAGPAIQLLALVKGQLAAATASFCALMVLLAMNAILVPLLGVLGAALAFICAQITWSTLLAVRSRRFGVASDIVSVLNSTLRDRRIEAYS